MDEINYRDFVPIPILSVLVLLPALLAVLLRSQKDEKRVYWTALGGGVFELLLTLLVIAKFRLHTASLQFVEEVPLAFGLSYHVGVDGISVLFLPLTALLGLLVTLFAQDSAKKQPGRYLASIFALEATLIGAFVSVDLLLFWVFALLEIVPGAILVAGFEKAPTRLVTARRYAAINAMGVVLLLAGVIVLGRATGAPPYSLSALLSTPVPERAQDLAFWLFMLGFAIRIPLFPFHGWLPPIMEAGPAVGVSVFLVGAKLGAYGILRVVVPLLPDALHRFGPLLAVGGVVGMLYGGLLALVQTNLRRLVAFACLSHTGSVLVGIASLNTEGFTGALLVTLNVGLSAAGLYFVAGFLNQRLGSTEVERASRLSSEAPLLALTFLLVGLATIGMPGTSGFEAEHLIVIGALGARLGIMAVAIAVGSLLGAAYLLRYFQRAFLGQAQSAQATPTPTAARAKITDLSARELVIAGAIATIIVGFGLFSRPVLSIVDGSVRAMSGRFESKDRNVQHAHP